MMNPPSDTKTVSALNHRASIGHNRPANGAYLLEKTKTSARKSTPDSEALASSDDDQDSLFSHRLKTARRPSHLNDFQPLAQRKSSFSAFSPTSTQPNTPSGDQNPTSTALANSHASFVTHNYPTGWTAGNIWSKDPRREPPARLSEMPQASPTSIIPPSPYGEADLVTSPTGRGVGGESSFPFTFPLHPTPKTYRSQSYSVGQQDADSNGTFLAANSSYFPAAARSNQVSGLQHRPSRPSMLSEMATDGNGLGQLRETEDDEEIAKDLKQVTRRPYESTKTVAELMRENARLKQTASDLRQAASNLDLESQKIRTRSTTTSSNKGFFVPQGNAKRDRGSIVEGSENAVDEADDVRELQGFGRYGFVGRRFSEVATDHDGHFLPLGPLENRKLESLKRGHWQSTAGPPGLEDISQSRRHSFAEVAPRNTSISSSGTASGSNPGNGLGAGISGILDHGLSYVDNQNRPQRDDNGEYTYFYLHRNRAEHAMRTEHLRIHQIAADYFGTNDAVQRRQEALMGMNRPLYPGVQDNALAQASQQESNQLLYIVTFKCCRAEIAYVEQGNGLEVKVGDLVIVDGDRGWDLGTIAHDSITWEEAKELKTHYGQEHYKWLMMYSPRGASQAGVANGVLPGVMMGSSTVGGMGPQNGQQNPQEAGSGEFKMKMVRRLAQPHEIQALKDKEGNEAKAKRVCQQKVMEHHLQMEILDAEFQMDWKKLTFFYFADVYINFNLLVTDLFKVYKTRIWMFAVNPQAISPPTAGLSPASSGSLPVGRTSPYDTHTSETLGYPGMGLGMGQFRTAPSSSMTPLNPQAYQTTSYQQNPYGYQYSQFPQQVRPNVFGGGGFTSGMAMPQTAAPAFGYPHFNAPRGPDGASTYGEHYGSSVDRTGSNLGSNRPTAPNESFGEAFQRLSLGRQ